MWIKISPHIIVVVVIVSSSSLSSINKLRQIRRETTGSAEICDISAYTCTHIHCLGSTCRETFPFLGVKKLGSGAN